MIPRPMPDSPLPSLPVSPHVQQGQATGQGPEGLSERRQAHSLLPLRLTAGPQRLDEGVCHQGGHFTGG